MNKHTPGQWKVTQRNFFSPFRISADSYSDIAEVSNEHDDETKANARLIAAAPEMHALLLQIHTELSRTASADVDPMNWEGYTLHRIEQLLWPEKSK